MVKNAIKLLTSFFSIFFLLFVFPSSASAAVTTTVSRVSPTAIKIHMANIQDSDFSGTFPANCFDASPYTGWYVEYRLSDSISPFNDILFNHYQNPEHTENPGHYPSDIDIIVDSQNFTHPWTSVSGIILNQRCSNNNEHAVNAGTGGLNLHLVAGIAADTGVLSMNIEDELDMYGFASDYNGSEANFDFDWDLDNNGSFESPGYATIFSSHGLEPGDYTVKLRATSPEGFSDIDEEVIHVLDFPFDVEITAGQQELDQVDTVNSFGFLNPESAIFNDDNSTVENGDHDAANLIYSFSSPVIPGYQFRTTSLVLRLKNAGPDPAFIQAIVVADRSYDLLCDTTTNSNSGMIPVLLDYTNYTCTYTLPSHVDPRYEMYGFYVNFDSWETQTALSVDAATFDYTYKKLVPNMTVDAAGPYTVNQGQEVEVSATSTDSYNKPHTYSWDLDNDGSFETSGQTATFSAATLTPGEYTIKVKTERATGASVTDEAIVTVVNADPVTVTFDASGDTYVRSGQDNHNYGSGTFMNLQSNGNNRSFVKFDQSAIQSAIGNGTVLSATLKLTITDNGNNWGSTGRTVDVHRLIADWTEGNGTENDRGDGNGATWNCAIDSLIENQSKNCSGSTEWEMGQPNNPSAHPWTETATDSETITNNQSGVVEYDVTNDVAFFMSGAFDNYGWLVKKTNEGQNGQVSFGTRESATVPQLVVTYQP